MRYIPLPVIKPILRQQSFLYTPTNQVSNPSIHATDRSDKVESTDRQEIVDTCLFCQIERPGRGGHIREHEESVERYREGDHAIYDEPKRDCQGTCLVNWR